MFSAIEKVVKRDDWIFAQDGALIRAEEWPPSSPDVNSLDYFLWDFVKTKVYEGRSGKLFASEAELKKKIKSVWNICSKDLIPIRKAINLSQE